MAALWMHKNVAREEMPGQIQPLPHAFIVPWAAEQKAWKGEKFFVIRRPGFQGYGSAGTRADISQIFGRPVSGTLAEIESITERP